MFKEGKYADLLGILALNKKRLSEEPEFWNIYGLTLRINAYTDKDADLRKDEINAFEKAIKLNPKWAVPYFNLATTYWETKKYSKACDIYRTALTVNPDYPDKNIVEKRIKQCEKKAKIKKKPKKIKEYKRETKEKTLKNKDSLPKTDKSTLKDKTLKDKKNTKLKNSKSNKFEDKKIQNQNTVNKPKRKGTK